MEKIFKLFVFLFLITIISNAHVFAFNRSSNESFFLATVPPTVVSPLYLCQNSVAVPLTASPSGGGTLNWYLTNLPTEIPSAIAPTPSTTIVGSTTYYVTETIGGIESTPRTPIVVNVVADTGAIADIFRCDATQVTTSTSVFFDWSHVVGRTGNSYDYSYSIQGGPTVFGNTFLSGQEVFGVQPGQSVTFTILTVMGLPCYPTQTLVCSLPCVTTTTPTFSPIIDSYCINDVPSILPTTSTNVTPITGTWNPSIINTSTAGTIDYTFTPDPMLFPCALTQTLPVTVTPLVTPTFTTIPAIVCQNDPAPLLPLNSSNTTPINGTWNPAIVDTSLLGPVTYTFTPDSGQCTSATLTTAIITIDQVLTPTFTAVPAICSGDILTPLPTTSNNGITGSWSPALNNTTTTTYTFTPTAGQCATTTPLTITVNQKVLPTFSPVSAICSGAGLAALPTTSINGYTGTWLPALDDTVTTTYTFTPTSGQCATTATLIITVTPNVIPNFVDMPICSGSVAPVLSSTSPNGITGTWDPPAVDNMNSGDYVFTPNAPQCATTKTIKVTVNPSNTLVSIAWDVTDAFSKNQIITISVNGTGSYLYQLDYGPFQVSPTFENVASGIHSITVKEINGCSTPITENNVLVIGYPKYFTPNGDTYNDYWNIYELKDQSDVRIYIFDRYGKLLKDITPLGLGWDGIYIGKPMPADDYWFTVKYVEKGSVKEFKSHFTLKR
ncbi:MAG: T9SS type B sorting domain-containing protein [Flavobacterium sp.]|uniref:T9SS type B sorting domain-containing protein n=1 Tax=Flavobacterium sp. TaxID=239 RepID=UPI0026075F3D|nr:T9SS type B sorting domain-containing protein [Flavobacterium sp.]MDD5149737.1 T9SS type B sorting domain-containing protein [Flavobacterium sp.]